MKNVKKISCFILFCLIMYLVCDTAYAAIRYDFHLQMPLFSTKNDIRAQADGNYKYIRVRIEPGTIGSDNIELRAVAKLSGTLTQKIATKVINISNNNIPIIVDFKAKNVSCRSDATYCVTCPTLTGISNDNYCVLSNSANYFGISFYNGALFGGTPTVHGGYSLEN